ncbi:MAG: DUF1232 domain-containing protein [Deltaproteobacteria bacterium]|nr:DUF1232 domain-containing protein [Deltaproteobacteria bacterium]
MSKKAGITEKLRTWAKQLKQEIYTLYFAYKDPRVPWFAKVFIFCVVGYALSPIDLIPDFIPVLGYLDDIILLPLGIALALKMIPSAVLTECRQKSRGKMNINRPRSVTMATMAIVVLLILIGFPTACCLWYWIR